MATGSDQSNRPDRLPLLAGNWKQNLTHLEAVVFVQRLAWTLEDKGHDPERSEVAVIPPFTALRSVQTLVEGDRLPIRLGAQDVSEHDGGAHTGEVSAAMLAALGCRYVLAGHSERRQEQGEDDALVSAKATRTLAAGMTPIVCVGEGIDVRREGQQVAHCRSQLDGSLSGLDPAQVAGLVVAYEPVWAIGTGEVATPADAQEVCAALRGRVHEIWGSAAAADVRILYGGSVKAANVTALMAEPDVDGALVGGASLQTDEFAGIARFYDLPVL